MQMRISGPIALGTRLLLQAPDNNNNTTSSGSSPGFGSRYPPPLALPRAAYRRPVVARSLDDEDVHDTDNHDVLPAPPVIIKMRKNPPPPIITIHPPPPPPPLPITTDPSPAATTNSLLSPNEESVPILHQPLPKLGSAPAKQPILVIVPPLPSSSSSSSSDGFTPLTPPTPSSPRKKKRTTTRFRFCDALGITTTTTPIVSRMRSQRAYLDHDDEDETEPLSPPPQAQLAVKPTTTKRKTTLFGVSLEGWWDLGLLERGRSLRRKK
ncbi:hypothetical protein F5Y17DRAFT_102255 [Xylariaceae sp. FL0594]|nr:hypothetical protein F5Y17DRAFT_102255 [Xylariaceae sp. FL0594]